MEKDKLLRITQIDAVHLDNEIYKIFLQYVQECTKYLPPGYTAPFEPELHLIIKLALLNYSLLKHNSTFGQKLLSVKYEGFTPTKKAVYIILSSLDYLKSRFELWKPSHDVNKLFFKIEAFIKVCAFINLSLFLKYGSKPLLIERILGLDQEYTHNVRRQFGSKYLTRELLWNGFIEILVYVLPLVNYHKIKRAVRTLNPFSRKPVFVAVEHRTFTVRTRCPHCGEPPIIPYHMGCPHIFCYTCLKGNIIADSKYECSICGYSSQNGVCERVSVI